MSTRVILIRHGATAPSAERRFAGTTDVDLSDEGREQATVVARRLRQVRIDALYVSPMARCRQTADAITESTGLKQRAADEIRECAFGKWEGLTSREVMDQFPEEFRQWLSDDACPPPDGESWTQVGERVGRWFQEAITAHEDNTILAVTHGGPILWLCRHLLQAPYSAMLTLEIDPCSLTLLQNRRNLWRIRLLNDTSHDRDALLDGPAPEAVPP